MKVKKRIVKIFKILVRPFLKKGIGKFFPVKAGYNFLISFLNPIIVEGNKIFVEPTDGLGLLISPAYEPFGTQIFKREVKEGDTVLDLGAHIGYYTLIAAKLVGPKGRVFAFEPNPGNFAFLKKNIKINGYRNIAPVQKAISNKNGIGRLYLARKSVSHRMYKSYGNQPFLEVETIRLDDFIKGRVDVVRLDIEGCEWLAIQGMNSILKRNSSIKIITRFSSRLSIASGIKPIEYLKTLKKWGFKLHEINEKEKELKPINNIEQLSQCTLLCKK